jgi:hypothetical protein
MKHPHKLGELLENFDQHNKLLDYKFMPRFVSESTPNEFLDAAVAILVSEQTEDLPEGF